MLPPISRGPTCRERLYPLVNELTADGFPVGGDVPRSGGRRYGPGEVKRHDCRHQLGSIGREHLPPADAFPRGQGSASTRVTRRWRHD